MIGPVLASLLSRPASARAISNALVSGRVARVTTPDGRVWLVFTGDAAHLVRRRVAQPPK